MTGRITSIAPGHDKGWIFIEPDMGGASLKALAVDCDFAIDTVAKGQRVEFETEGGAAIKVRLAS